MMLSNDHHHNMHDPATVNARIDDAFHFIEDVIDEPSVLDRIPNGSSIQLSRLPADEEHASVVTHTKRFAVSINEKSTGS